MAYRITNETLGTVIVVDQLPPGVVVGVHDIGPSWDNRPPPKSIVEEIEDDQINDPNWVGSRWHY